MSKEGKKISEQTVDKLETDKNGQGYVYLVWIEDQLSGVALTRRFAEKAVKMQRHSENFFGKPRKQVRIELVMVNHFFGYNDLLKADVLKAERREQKKK